MNTKRMRSLLAGLFLMSAVGISPAPAEDLGGMLREAGWDRIIGVWVDQETKGEKIRACYAWKFENKLIELTIKTERNEAVALIGLNGKTGEIYQVGADSDGVSSMGKWSGEDAAAVLELSYVTETGDEGSVRARHHFEDDDTMVITLGEGPEPVTITMCRSAKK